MDNGWVKLWRKLLSNGIIKDGSLLQVFIYCLLRAGHEEKRMIFNGKEITLKPGEFISGRKEASKELKLKSIMWDRKLQVLENLQILNRKPNNRFSIISIINWNTYQGSNIEDEQPYEQQMNNKRTTDEQQMNTNKNVKNIKNIKKRGVPPKSTEEFLEEIKKSPAYSHINIPNELEKMRIWILSPQNTKGRKLNSRFILNWINKIEKPLDTGGSLHGSGEIPPTDAMERKLWELKRIREREEHPESSTKLH